MYRFLFILLFCWNSFIFGNDPLPSWNEGKAKQAILNFVRDTTKEGSPSYVPVEERIATFDQDGTLLVEQPLYSQLFFAIDRIQALASSHPDWQHTEPFQAILEGKLEKNAVTEKEIAKIVAVTHSGMSVETFQEQVREWLAKALHPHFKRPFSQLVYQPMREVIRLLQDSGFKTYIVSGSGQEFIRVYSDGSYGIPREHVIGSAAKVKYEIVNGKPTLIKLPEILFIDDKTGKPEGINLIIGRRPLAAFGNSTGDREMLEWTQGGTGLRLQLLVHHDDAAREYAYGPDSKIGYFPDSLLKEAKEKGWVVVSMKDDWKVIFPWDNAFAN